MRHLRWLTFLGLLGVTGIVTDYNMFRAMFGFFAFMPLFWYDERTEAVFKQAATITYVVTTISLAATFVYLGLVLGPGLRNAERVDIAGTFATALAVTYMLHLLTFALTYIYFEVRGFRK